MPDNSQPAGRPVFFEGRLREFERHIGVVWVRLEAPALLADAPDGTVFLRGQAAVILRGPAVLERAFPFHVERPPRDRATYWPDLRLPHAQFESSFSADKVADEKHPSEGAAKTKAVISRSCAGAID